VFARIDVGFALRRASRAFQTFVCVVTWVALAFELKCRCQAFAGFQKYLRVFVVERADAMERIVFRVLSDWVFFILCNVSE
jgi:hypothetical protein